MSVMETQQRIVCQWCQTQNLPESTTCQSCGGPLDVRNIINVPVSTPESSSSPSAAQDPLRPLRIGMGTGGWVTVATFQYCGAFHAARALLSKASILSRVGPSSDDSPEMEMQTPSADAERAIGILDKTIL